MIKKYQQFGSLLSNDAMKEIKGGAAPPPATRYECWEGSWQIFYCGYVSPYPTCGHDYCNEIGSCSPATFNGINCQ